jgi:hypothetical protein
MDSYLHRVADMLMLHLDNLDAYTRRLMSDEIKQDIMTGRLYRSPLLSETGRRDYPRLLTEAAEHHNEVWLASALLAEGCILVAQVGLNGVKSPVSDEAVRVLADMAFNRYYCRAVCGRAIEHGVSVSVYWADEDPHASQEVRACEMWRLDPGPLRELLRTQPSLEAALNIPGGRRTGLSLFFSSQSQEDA